MAFSDSERGELREVTYSQISPREYGRLEAKVDALEAEVAALRGDVRSLLDLANQSRGGLWVGMGIASMCGGVVTWMAQRLLER